MPSWLLTSVQISIHKFKIHASVAICFLATVRKEEKPKADAQVGEELLPGLANFPELWLYFFLPSRIGMLFLQGRISNLVSQFTVILGYEIGKWPESFVFPPLFLVHLIMLTLSSERCAMWEKFFYLFYHCLSVPSLFLCFSFNTGPMLPCNLLFYLEILKYRSSISRRDHTKI